MLTGSVLPAGDMHELPKMANLVKHYEEHLVESNQQLSFLAYLELHYAGPESGHSQEHEGLPFHHLCTTAFAAIIPSASPETHIIAEVRSSYTGLYSFSVVRDHVPNVWQPPKC